MTDINCELICQKFEKQEHQTEQFWPTKERIPVLLYHWFQSWINFLVINFPLHKNQ